MGIFLFIILFTAIPYFAPMLARTATGLFSLVFCILTVCGIIFALSGYSNKTNYDEDWGFGTALIVFMVFYFLYGAIIRAMTFAARYFTKHNTGLVALIITLGFMAPPGFLAGSIGYKKWDRRSPSKACLEVTHPVSIGNLNLKLPMIDVFTIHQNKNYTSSPFYLFSNKAKREFCNATGVGQSGLRIKKLRVGLHSRYQLERTCKAVASQIRQPSKICKMLKQASSEDQHKYIPGEIHIFEKMTDNLGNFGGIVSTYDNSLISRSNKIYAQHQTLTSPNEKPITAECYKRSNNQYHCKIAYEFKENAILMFSFNSEKQEIHNKIERTNNWTTAFIANLKK